MAEQQDEQNKQSEEIEQAPQAPEEPVSKVADGDSAASAEQRGGNLGDHEEIMADEEPPKSAGTFKRFFGGYWHKKKWTLPLTLFAVLAIILIVPVTRYKVLGLFVTKTYAVEFIDSKTDTPISGISLKLDGKFVATTNADGAAKFHAKVGPHSLQVDKKYYETYTKSIFVGLKSQKTTEQMQLVATGRQVPIKIVDNITNNPVAGAEVKLLDTEAKTDSNGMATIVLPTTSSTQPATITATGFNDLSTKIQVTGKVVPGNTFAVTPSGKVYFLSNLSGNIDVVSTNLDGTSRQTVLTGTGSEDQNNTVLLASTDWKYLALLSKRDGGQDAKLFLINTNNNQLTTIDGSAASFTPVGWVGHHFVYEADMDKIPDWQSGHSVLKSYDAETGSTVTIDKTTASGTSDTDFVGQNFDYGQVYIVGGSILYTKDWSSGFMAAASALKGNQDQIISVAPDGSGKQVLKSIAVPADGYQNINALAYKPNVTYFQVNNNSGDTYYVYQNSSLTQSNTITDSLYQQYQQNYSTYLASPSGGQTFWAEQRDGKNTLFVGDASGNDGKQIASLSDFTSYGWYTDKYLLVEKGGSELYIMPASGGTALQISDYYKSSHSLYGYGSGYGGL